MPHFIATKKKANPAAMKLLHAAAQGHPAAQHYIATTITRASQGHTASLAAARQLNNAVPHVPVIHGTMHVQANRGQAIQKGPVHRAPLQMGTRSGDFANAFGAPKKQMAPSHRPYLGERPTQQMAPSHRPYLDGGEVHPDEGSPEHDGRPLGMGPISALGRSELQRDPNDWKCPWEARPYPDGNQPNPLTPEGWPNMAPPEERPDYGRIAPYNPPMREGGYAMPETGDGGGYGGGGSDFGLPAFGDTADEREAVQADAMAPGDPFAETTYEEGEDGEEEDEELYAAEDEAADTWGGSDEMNDENDPYRFLSEFDPQQYQIQYSNPEL